MRRDDDLIRRIMLAVEAQAPGETVPSEELAETLERPHGHVVEHLMMLEDVGWIETIDASTLGEPARLIERVTMPGHDFLAAIRKETVWREVLRRASPFGSVPLDVMKAIATAEIRRALGLPGGE